MILNNLAPVFWPPAGRRRQKRSKRWVWNCCSLGCLDGAWDFCILSLIATADAESGVEDKLWSTFILAESRHTRITRDLEAVGRSSWSKDSRARDGWLSLWVIERYWCVKTTLYSFNSFHGVGKIYNRVGSSAYLELWSRKLTTRPILETLQ